jgi:hypothetical protein
MRTCQVIQIHHEVNQINRVWPEITPYLATFKMSSTSFDSISKNPATTGQTPKRREKPAIPQSDFQIDGKSLQMEVLYSSRPQATTYLNPNQYTNSYV